VRHSQSHYPRTAKDHLVLGIFSKGKLPKRWRTDSLRALVEATGRPEILEEAADEPRVTVSAPEDADWTPHHHRFAGNILVVADIQFAGKDPHTAEIYRAYVDGLEAIADWRLPVSQFAFVLGTEKSVDVVFDAVLGAIGVRHHSLLVVDLMDGSAVAWNAEDGRTAEIDPMAPGHDEEVD
jgi:hypothetical protein